MYSFTWISFSFGFNFDDDDNGAQENIWPGLKCLAFQCFEGKGSHKKWSFYGQADRKGGGVSPLGLDIKGQ